MPLPKKGMIVDRRILENIMEENSNFILKTPPICRSIDQEVQQASDRINIKTVHLGTPESPAENQRKRTP